VRKKEPLFVIRREQRGKNGKQEGGFRPKFATAIIAEGRTNTRGQGNLLMGGEGLAVLRRKQKWQQRRGVWGEESKSAFRWQEASREKGRRGTGGKIIRLGA